MVVSTYIKTHQNIVTLLKFRVSMIVQLDFMLFVMKRIKSKRRLGVDWLTAKQ